MFMAIYQLRENSDPDLLEFEDVGIEYHTPVDLIVAITALNPHYACIYQVEKEEGCLPKYSKYMLWRNNLWNKL